MVPQNYIKLKGAKATQWCAGRSLEESDDVHTYTPIRYRRIEIQAPVAQTNLSDFQFSQEPPGGGGAAPAAEMVRGRFVRVD